MPTVSMISDLAKKYFRRQIGAKDYYDGLKMRAEEYVKQLTDDCGTDI